MLTYFAKLLIQKNTIISRINFALIELNFILSSYIAEHAELINYSFEPNSNPPDKYLIYDYPNIQILLPPFNACIKYEDVISRLNNNYKTDHIIEVVINLIIEKML